MAIFENKFLSVAGQKERLANVGATLKAAVTGKGVQSNTSSTVVNKVLSTAASNPFTTAAVAAVAVSPATAVAAVKAAPKTVIGTTLVAPAVVSVVATAPKQTAKAIAETPSNVAQFAGNVAGLVTDPSIENAKNIVKDNPVISGAIIAGTAIVAGKAVTGAAANIANTIATNKNTQILKDKATTTKDVVLSSTGNTTTSSTPLEPQLVNVTRSVTTGSRKISKKLPPTFAPSLRITINNQNKSTKFIKFSKYTA